MKTGDENIAKLNKDIDIATELLLLLKNSTHIQGDTSGVNYSEVKRTRLMIHKLLKRHEQKENE